MLDTSDSDLEAELEVDELDSDSEINEGVSVLNEVNVNDDVVTLPPRTKPGERVIGHSLLPLSRVENMIQVDGMVG